MSVYEHLVPAWNKLCFSVELPGWKFHAGSNFYDRNFPPFLKKFVSNLVFRTKDTNGTLCPGVLVQILVEVIEEVCYTCDELITSNMDKLEPIP